MVGDAELFSKTQGGVYLERVGEDAGLKVVRRGLARFKRLGEEGDGGSGGCVEEACNVPITAGSVPCPNIQASLGFTLGPGLGLLESRPNGYHPAKRTYHSHVTFMFSRAEERDRTGEHIQELPNHSFCKAVQLAGIEPGTVRNQALPPLAHTTELTCTSAAT